MAAEGKPSGLRDHGLGGTKIQDAIRTDGDMVRLEITLKRPWKFAPGQYAYVRVLTLWEASWAQTHPFVIAWWLDPEPLADSLLAFALAR